ncbi:Uncharacterised protein [uncultured Ruminococcus sp.]|nr:Uncharacterised protein [uncultured Ruminococcus sp.]
MKKNLCKKITFLMDMFSARRRIDTLEPWAKHINVLLLPIRSKRLITSCTSLLLLQTVFPAYVYPRNLEG